MYGGGLIFTYNELGAVLSLFLPLIFKLEQSIRQFTSKFEPVIAVEGFLLINTEPPAGFKHRFV